MNQARVGLLLAAALLTVPGIAAAQKKGAKGAAAAEQKAGKDAATGQAGSAESKEINLDEPAAGSDTPSSAPSDEPVGGDSGLGDICKIDPAACPTIDLDKAAARNLDNQMYAVQQIYALRNHRVELNPYWGVTMNDQFVSHPGPGLGVNYYLTNVFAVGVNGNVYAGLNANSDFNFQTSRSARVGEPVTEYAWNANVNLQFVPAYGKFAGFGDFIFHYDVFTVLGAGLISTRPIAVIDPDNRSFTFSAKPNGHIGGGLRIFFNRWFAAMFEVSDYVFYDQLENPLIASGIDSTGKSNSQNKDTWLAKDASFTNNVQAQVGVSVFLPFSWEYQLAK